MSSIKQFVSLLRVSHWLKAAFVLLGVFYSGSLALLPRALLAAFAFCLIASAVYIYNDLQDIHQDRLHPHKRRRPLAAEEVSLKSALTTLAVLLLGGLLLGWSVSTQLTAFLGLYLLINLAYNHLLKNLPMVDVLCIASGFMLRVLAGTVGIDLPISWWLTVTATLVSLFIALCKRRLEKQLGLKYATRPVLKKYSFHELDIMIISSAVCCFMSYFLYTSFAHEETFYFLLTIPFAAVGLSRFAWLAIRGGDSDDPVSLVVGDNLSRFNLLCFLILTFIAILNE